MLGIQRLTCRDFCGVCHCAEVCRSMSGDGITLTQSLIVPDEGIDHSLINYLQAGASEGHSRCVWSCELIVPDEHGLPTTMLPQCIPEIQ